MLTGSYRWECLDSVPSILIDLLHNKASLLDFHVTISAHDSFTGFENIEDLCFSPKINSLQIRDYRTNPNSFEHRFSSVNRETEKLIRSLHNLQYLHVNYGSGVNDPALGSYNELRLARPGSSLPKLRSLTLEHYKLDDYDKKSLVLPSNLQSLSLLRCQGVNHLDNVLARSTTKLQTLVIDDPVHIGRYSLMSDTMNALQITIGQHRDTLQVLVIRNVKFPLPLTTIYFHEGGNKLRILDLHNDIHNLQGTTISHLHLAVLLKRCPQLEVLCTSLERTLLPDDVVKADPLPEQPYTYQELDQQNNAYFPEIHHIKDDPVKSVHEMLSSFPRLRKLRIYISPSHHLKGFSSRKYAIIIGFQVWGPCLQTFDLLSSEEPERERNSIRSRSQRTKSDMESMHWHFSRDVWEANAPLRVTDMQEVAWKANAGKGLMETAPWSLYNDGTQSFNYEAKNGAELLRLRSL